MATIEEILTDLDRQEKENEERFRTAIHAYFDVLSRIAGARQALIYVRDTPDEEVTNGREVDTKSENKKRSAA